MVTMLQIQGTVIHTYISLLFPSPNVFSTQLIFSSAWYIYTVLQKISEKVSKKFQMLQRL